MAEQDLRRALPSSRLHNRAVLSAEPDNSVCPSDETAIAVTASTCPANSRASSDFREIDQEGLARRMIADVNDSRVLFPLVNPPRRSARGNRPFPSDLNDSLDPPTPGVSLLETFFRVRFSNRVWK